MAILACSVEGCDTPSRTRGWCMKHYQMQYRGTPLGEVTTTADCARCGETFTASHGKKFCTRKCREEAKYAELRNDPERWAAYLEKLRNGYTKTSDRPGYIRPAPKEPEPCSDESCERVAKSRGLCSTHYNQTYAPNRHKKTVRNCDSCGAEVLKYAASQRYEKVICADPLCRQWVTFSNGLTSKLPKNHWALIIGSTCEWPKPSMLKTYEPKPKMDFTCEWCGQAFQSHQRSAKYCGAKCVKRRQRKIRRAREHNAPGYFTWTEVTRLWLLFDKSCAYCSSPLGLGDVEAEHVQPLSRQGRNDISNILPSCRACNCDKQAYLLAEWATMRAKRGLPPVKTTWDWADVRYRHLVPHAMTLAA